MRLLALADDALAPLRRLDRVQARLLRIAWGPPVPRRDAADGAQWADAWLVAGCADSSVRKFDVASGRVLERMTAHRARGERTLVWAAGVLGCVSPRARSGRG